MAEETRRWFDFFGPLVKRPSRKQVRARRSFQRGRISHCEMCRRVERQRLVLGRAWDALYPKSRA